MVIDRRYISIGEKKKEKKGKKTASGKRFFSRTVGTLAYVRYISTYYVHLPGNGSFFLPTSALKKI
jgi:hypothetical protein